MFKKPDPVEMHEDKRAEEQILDPFAEANVDDSVPDADKSVITSANYDVISNIPKTDLSTPEALKLGGITFSNKLPNSVLQGSLSNVSVNDDPNKKSVASETNIASEFSEQESNIRITWSDNAQNSDSGRRKSYIPSKVNRETVKDLSQLNREAIASFNSEVAALQSNILKSLKFEGDTFNENDSGVFQQSLECKLINEKLKVVDNKRGLKIEGCKQTKFSCGQELKQPVRDDLTSMKLSISCQELAKNVSRIEKIKNDLLRAFVKSKRELSLTDFQARSFPDMSKISSGRQDKFRPNSAPSSKSLELRSGTGADPKTNMSVSDTNVVVSKNLSYDESEHLLYGEANIFKNTEQHQADVSECGVVKESQTSLQPIPACTNFSDLSSESNVNEADTKLDAQTIVRTFSVYDDLKAGQPFNDLSSNSSVNVSGIKLDGQTLSEAILVYDALETDKAFSELTSKSSLGISGTKHFELLSKAFLVQNVSESNVAFRDPSSKSNIRVSDSKHVSRTPAVVCLVHEDLKTYDAFSDLSFKSSANVSVTNFGVQKRAKTSPASSEMQPVFVSNICSEGKVLVDTDIGEEMRVKISTGSKFENCGDLFAAEKEGNNVTRSSFELSNEIWEHLKLGSELLMQLYPLTNEVLMPTAMRSASETKKIATKIVAPAPNSSSVTTLSHSEPEIDDDGVVFLSSVGSTEFECFMSQFPKTVREATKSMSEFSWESFQELFSDISSERFRIDCSQDLEASIKEVLCNDTVDPRNFVMENF